MESEIGELVDDNKVLENELRNLGEKTNVKIGDMHKKMQTNVKDLDSFKYKNNNEIKTLNMNIQEKLDRLNDDFTKRIDMLKEKVEEAEKEKQDLEVELKRLQNVKVNEENALESAIKRKKERFYEDSHHRFSTTLKMIKNEIRAAEEQKKVKDRKLNELTDDCDTQKKEYEQEIRIKQEKDDELRMEIKSMRQEIADREAAIEANRADLYAMDNELQREASELQKNRFELKQVNEKGDYNLKEIKHRHNVEREQEQNKEYQLSVKNEQLKEELYALQEKVKQQLLLNQKTVESMKMQLNRNINQTINEHKETKINVPLHNNVSKGASFYMNGNY